MLDIETRKELAKISCQISETAQRIARPNITLSEVLHENKMLDVHMSNINHVVEQSIDRMS